MEENRSGAGGVLKTLALVLFWVNAISAVITMFCMLGVGDGELGFLALLVLVIGIVMAVAGSALLYGFGELVENSARSVAKLQRLEERLSERGGREDRTPVSSAPRPAARPLVGSMAPKTETVTVQPSGSGTITCPACGCVQRSDRTVCWQCGAKFVLQGDGSEQTPVESRGDIICTCGSCGHKYKGVPTGEQACPNCGSTLKLYS